MDNGGTYKEDQQAFSQKSAAKKLTRKQRIFADYLINNPTASGKSAAKEAYPTVNDATAYAISSENLRKPNIMQYMQDHTLKAEQRVVQAMNATKKIYKQGEKGKWEFVGEEDDHSIRLKAADSLLDRVYGKATQKVQTTTSVVTLSVNLSGDSAGPVPQHILDQLG